MSYGHCDDDLWNYLSCNLVSHRKKLENFCCAECFPRLPGLYLSCLNSIKAPLCNQWRDTGASRQGIRSCPEPVKRKLYIRELKWSLSCWDIISSLSSVLHLSIYFIAFPFVLQWKIDDLFFDSPYRLCVSVGKDCSVGLLSCWTADFKIYFVSSYCHLLKFQAGHLQSRLLVWAWLYPIPCSRARNSVPVCAGNHGNKYDLNGTPYYYKWSNFAFIHLLKDSETIA